MTSPRIWADPLPPSDEERRDELARQLHRLPGIVAVEIEAGLIRLALDPRLPEAISITDLQDRLDQAPRGLGPRTIEIAIRTA